MEGRWGGGGACGGALTQYQPRARPALKRTRGECHLAAAAVARLLAVAPLRPPFHPDVVVVVAGHRLPPEVDLPVIGVEERVEDGGQADWRTTTTMTTTPSG